MVVRIALTDRAPENYPRVETRLLPAVGEILTVQAEEPQKLRFTFAIRSVDEGAEPVLHVSVSEAEETDHFGKALGPFRLVMGFDPHVDEYPDDEGDHRDLTSPLH